MGILYIAFEKSLIAQTAPSKGLGSSDIDNVSRAILGAQVSITSWLIIAQLTSIRSAWSHLP